MAITSGFFDSVNGDRMYDADQMSTYFDGLISDGVYENIGDRFAVTSSHNGMEINVGSGRAIIQSHWVKNDATVILTLDPADLQLNRIDAVVLRLDTSARSISLTVKSGTAVSGTPSMPEITRSGTVYELYIASVLVNRGAAQPTRITDLRPSSYCGWVTGIIRQVDTSDLFTQWETAYEDFYSSMTAQFDAYMQNKMDAFNSWFATLTGQLTVEAGMIKLQSTVTVSAGSNGAPVNIDEYDMEQDVLFAFVDGAFYTEGVDYVLDKVSIYPYPIMRLLDGKTFGKSARITFIVLKNIIGKDVLLVGDGELVADSAGTAIVTSGGDFEEVS